MSAVVARIVAVLVSLLQLVMPVASSHSDAVVDDVSPHAVDASVTGTASWYRWRLGQAAAGPALRVGAWRGRVVNVCTTSRCVRVALTDWCACPNHRVVDLDARSFAALAPLSRGLVRVSVSVVSSVPVPTLPPTDRN